MTLEGKLNIECDTVDKKLQYCMELKRGGLLNFHNDNTVVDGEEKSALQVLAFHKSWFAPKAKELERVINKLCDFKYDEELGMLIKDLPEPTDYWNPKISDLDYIKGKAVDVVDPYEDLLNDYTEVDPNNRFTISGAGNKRVDVSGLTRNEDAYFWRSHGAGFWSGDFEIICIAKMDNSGSPAFIAPIAITNDLDDILGLINNNKDALYITLARSGAGDFLQIVEVDGGTTYADTESGIDNSKIFIITFERDEAIGTYGTIYMFVREGAVLLYTKSVALHTSKKDFQNTMVGVSLNNGTDVAPNWNGYITDIDLQLAVAANKFPLSQFVNSGINSGIHRGGLTNA
jgi:hypothetical protein